MSDLDIEVAPEPDLRRLPPHDVVVLAGDISDSLVRTVEWATSISDRPVLVVPGNREFWGLDVARTVAEARDICDRTAGHVQLLQESTAIVDGVVFAGCTLWTDYALFGDELRAWVLRHCEQTVDDHRWIRSDGHRSRGWSTEDAFRSHHRQMTWLRRTASANRGRPLVAVTHHAPSPLSIGRVWASDLCAASVASDLRHEIMEMDPVLWLHGSERTDHLVGSTRVVGAPGGLASSCCRRIPSPAERPSYALLDVPALSDRMRRSA